MACEAEALAELKDEWKPKRDPTALLVGNYLHSYFQSRYAHNKFKQEHPEIISTRGATKGQLKREYQVADNMIRTLRTDPKFKEFYQGKKKSLSKARSVGWLGKANLTA